MSEKKFIEELYQEKAKNDSNSRDLSSSLNILSKTVFGDVNRFIFELLQNADDSPLSKDSNVEVEFRLLNNYLVFKHTGKHFSENDIVGISSVGGRASEKDRDIEKTGYKGIGFKSVFGSSDCVYIVSDKYSFKFDKHHSVWTGRTDFPWQVIPIWSDSLPSETNNYVESQKVNTIISVGDRKLVYQEILKTFEDGQIMLFLRNVSKITFVEQENAVFEIEKKQSSERVRELYRNKKLVSKWAIKDFILQTSPDVTAKLQKLSETECPQKLKDSKTAKITFAAGVADKGIVPLSNATMYCYLPTKVANGFPFMINADFITNAERTEFLINDWNAFLFNQIAISHIEWLKELAGTGVKHQILKLLKEQFRNPRNSSEKAYNDGLIWAVNNIAFIPTQDGGQLVKASDAIFDSTTFTSTFADSPITALVYVFKPI